MIEITIRIIIRRIIRIVSAEFPCLQDVTWLCAVRSYASFGTERFQISLDREEKRSIASAKHRGGFGHGGLDRCGVCGVLTFTLSQQPIRTTVARPVDCFMVKARIRECVFNAKVIACPLQKIHIIRGCISLAYPAVCSVSSTSHSTFAKEHHHTCCRQSSTSSVIL